MQHDPLLSADARRACEHMRLWADQPPFAEAERLHLPSYHEAVGKAQADRAEVWELNICRVQLRLLNRCIIRAIPLGGVDT